MFGMDNGGLISIRFADVVSALTAYSSVFFNRKRRTEIFRLRAAHCLRLGHSRSYRAADIFDDMISGWALALWVLGVGRWKAAQMMPLLKLYNFEKKWSDSDFSSPRYLTSKSHGAQKTPKTNLQIWTNIDDLSYSLIFKWTVESFSVSKNIKNEFYIEK